LNPLERQLDLLLLLLSKRGPLSAREIFDAMPPEAYAGDMAAKERKFSRDKAELRDLGLPLVSEADEEGLTLYSVDAAALFLPDVPFPAAERAALFTAGAAALKAGFPFGAALHRSLAALRATGPDDEERARPVDAPAVVASKAPPAHVKLLETAFLERRKLRFTYPPEPQTRIVRPYALSHRRGRLVVVAWCELRNAIRTFHADRLVAPALATKPGGNEFEVPADFKAADHLPGAPWTIRKHPPVNVTLAYDAGWEHTGPRQLDVPDAGPVPATNLDGLISQVAALGGARLVSPADARARVHARFAALAARLASEPA